MKMLLKVLLISLLGGLNDVQASDDSHDINDSRQIKPRQKRYFEGSNPENNEIKGSSAIRSCKMCGQSFASPYAGMVVKGNEVQPPYKYPWSVAIQAQGETVCGGSLLNENYVVTAAHCLIKPEENEELEKDGPGKKKKLKYMKPKELSISFVTKTSRVKRGPPIEALIPHPGFAKSHLKNDIALMKLSRKVTCNKFISPICLPSADVKINVGQILTIAGWGTAGNNSKNMSEVLKEAKIRHVNFNKCANSFPRYMESLAYCLMGIRGQSPCMGDSGGPMFDKLNGKYFLYGVTSKHSSEVCDADATFIYTSVPKHIQWIKKVMGSSFPKQAKQTSPGLSGRPGDSQGTDEGDVVDRLPEAKGNSPGLLLSGRPKGERSSQGGSQGSVGGDFVDLLPETNGGSPELPYPGKSIAERRYQGSSQGSVERDIVDLLPETNEGFRGFPYPGRSIGERRYQGSSQGSDERDIVDLLPETNEGSRGLPYPGRSIGERRYQGSSQGSVERDIVDLLPEKNEGFRGFPYPGRSIAERRYQGGSQGSVEGDVGDRLPETNGGSPGLPYPGSPPCQGSRQGSGGGDVGDVLPEKNTGSPGLPYPGRSTGVPRCKGGSQDSVGGDAGDLLPETNGGFPGLPHRGKPKGERRCQGGSQGSVGGNVGDRLPEINGGSPGLPYLGRSIGVRRCQGGSQGGAGGDVGDLLPETNGGSPGLPYPGRSIGVPRCQGGSQGSVGGDDGDLLPQINRGSLD